MLRFGVRVPPGPALSLFTGTLTMMPGSLSVTEHAGSVELHVLAGDAHTERIAAKVENAVARAAGVEANDA